MNMTPLRREVEETIAHFQRVVDDLRTSYSEVPVRADAEREAMIADGRAAIERARTNGSAWRIWERILDEFEHGSTDARGTDFDALRRFASVLDPIQGKTIEPYVSASVSFHPRSLAEAVAVVDALAGATWRRGNSPNLLKWVPPLGITGFRAPEVDLFIRAEWASDLVAHIKSRGAEAEKEPEKTRDEQIAELIAEVNGGPA